MRGLCKIFTQLKMIKSCESYWLNIVVYDHVHGYWVGKVGERRRKLRIWTKNERVLACDQIFLFAFWIVRFELVILNLELLILILNFEFWNFVFGFQIWNFGFWILNVELVFKVFFNLRLAFSTHYLCT